MYTRTLLIATLSALVLGMAAAGSFTDTAAPALKQAIAPQLFKTGDRCMSCHNGLATPSGEDISIGADWRASMMANSARDPYWQAAVRREVTDNPMAGAAIEEECSTCHMPMAHYQMETEGRQPGVFANLPVGAAATAEAPLAADGVSCTMCHQITSDRFGTRESFVGQFVVRTSGPEEGRAVFGPFSVDAGRVRIMQSASTFRQEEATHIQESEMCATCHTLYTHSLGEGGEVIGELPEQVPYLEWLHSAYREERSCQSCHMPVVADSTAISSVMGQPRAGVSRHVFRGGNFFMPGMLNRYRGELGVQALPQELDVTRARTIAHLQSQAARVSIERLQVTGGRLEAAVRVENLAGHKLPTAYPSRRAWIHFVVRDASGGVVFESGKMRADGSIVGNDNDEDPSRYEAHHDLIDASDAVQIYEPILVGPDEIVTTGLLTAVDYIKDNRLLPRGFDKATADDDIAVKGAAADDETFQGASDQVRYAVDVSGAAGPFVVEATLWYQPIGFRWAKNLASYQSTETDRFTRYFESMADRSGVALASGSAVTR